MYYLFSPKLTYWHDDIIQANLLNKPSSNFETSWINGKHLSKVFEFQFSLVDEAPILDNYWTGNIYSLYSKKLLSLLSNYQINFDTFPAKIFSKNTGEFVALNYKVFRLNEISDCLDESKTVYKFFSAGGRQLKSLVKPLFTEKFLKSKKMLTCIAGYERLVVIHSELKNIIEDENISGCEFTTERLDESSLFSTL